MLLSSLLFIWKTWDPKWVRTDPGSHGNSGDDLRSEPRGFGLGISWGSSSLGFTVQRSPSLLTVKIRPPRVRVIWLPWPLTLTNPTHMCSGHISPPHTLPSSVSRCFPLPMAMLSHKWQPRPTSPWIKHTCPTSPPPNHPQGSAPPAHSFMWFTPQNDHSLSLNLAGGNLKDQRKIKRLAQGHMVSLSLNPSSSRKVFLPLLSHAEFSALRVPPTMISITPWHMCYMFPLLYMPPKLPFSPQSQSLTKSCWFSFLSPKYSTLFPHPLPLPCSSLSTSHMNDPKSTPRLPASRLAAFNLLFWALAVRPHWFRSQHITSFCDTPSPHKDKILAPCWAIKATHSSGPCQASRASSLATLASHTVLWPLNWLHVGPSMYQALPSVSVQCLPHGRPFPHRRPNPNELTSSFTSSKKPSLIPKQGWILFSGLPQPPELHSALPFVELMSGVLSPTNGKLQEGSWLCLQQSPAPVWS